MSFKYHTTVVSLKNPEEKKTFLKKSYHQGLTKGSFLKLSALWPKFGLDSSLIRFMIGQLQFSSLNRLATDHNIGLLFYPPFLTILVLVCISKKSTYIQLEFQKQFRIEGSLRWPFYWKSKVAFSKFSKQQNAGVVKTKSSLRIRQDWMQIWFKDRCK